jgi:hypothetical protein
MSLPITPAAAVSPARDLCTWAEWRYVGLIQAENVFHGHLPDINVDEGSLYFLDTGGPANRFDSAWSEWTVQIKTRSPQGQYDLGKDLIHDIFRVLHGAHRLVLDNIFVDVCYAIQPPFNLGRCEKNREEFVFNILIKGYER